MDIFDKFSGERLGEVREASAADVHRAVTRAAATAPAWGAVAAHKRSTILRRTAELLGAKRDALAELIARESGKAWRYAIAEVECLNLDTFAEAERFYSYRRATRLCEADYGRQASLIGLPRTST